MSETPIAIKKLKGKKSQKNGCQMKPTPKTNKEITPAKTINSFRISNPYFNMIAPALHGLSAVVGIVFLALGLRPGGAQRRKRAGPSLYYEGPQRKDIGE